MRGWFLGAVLAACSGEAAVMFDDAVAEPIGVGGAGAPTASDGGDAAAAGNAGGGGAVAPSAAGSGGALPEVPDGWAPFSLSGSPACVDAVAYYAELPPVSCSPCACASTLPECDPGVLYCGNGLNDCGSSQWGWWGLDGCQQVDPNIVGLPPFIRCRAFPPTKRTHGVCDVVEAAPVEAAPPIFACPGSSGCIARPGAHECPDAWGERRLVHRTLDDSRECSPCACASNDGGECSGGGWVSFGESNASCDGAGSPVADGDSCTTFYPPFRAEHRGELTPSLECQPSGGVASGSVEGVDPVTFCCLEG